MTLENAKRLYEHYVKIGRQDLAEDIAKNRPEVIAEQKTEKKEKVK